MYLLCMKPIPQWYYYLYVSQKILIVISNRLYSVTCTSESPGLRILNHSNRTDLRTYCNLLLERALFNVVVDEVSEILGDEVDSTVLDHWAQSFPMYF